MQNKNAFKQYQKTQVTTASPEKILLLLYEGAIRFVKIAQVRMQEKNIAEKGKYISKTMAIVSELMNTLDHKVGGQLAADLENLYMFMIDKLIEANIKNEPEHLEVVEKLLTTLYGAWQDVVNNPRADGVPSAEHQPDLHAMMQQANRAQQTQAPQARPANAQAQQVPRQVMSVSPIRKP